MREFPKLLALEKNILKYRALQMILLLHQVESLKKFVLGSVRATHGGMFPVGTKNLFSKVWNLLVKEDILTLEDSKDIQRIIDVRNDVGHSIHYMVSDITMDNHGLPSVKEYDYYAQERIESYREKIEKGFSGKYVLSIGFRDLIFEAAEETYKEELSRLNKKIERQYAKRKALAEKCVVDV